MNVRQTCDYATNFKSGFPVVHWVRETNGKYAPAVSSALNIKLQKSIIRLLNTKIEKAKPERLASIDYVKKAVSAMDTDFANNPVARSFYNPKGGWKEGIFEPFGYILTGLHAEYLTENFGKPIGKAKAEAPRIKDELADTAEVNMALGDYFQQGVTYVKRLASQFKDGTKMRYGLHTKFEIIRTKTGKIKEFKLVDLKFCPEEGSENPFIKMGYVK